MPTTRTATARTRCATPRSAVGGETKKYYHFQTADDGVYDYYDETGKSAKKFLVRKPVAVGMVTSPFGWRTHPMLHVSELHTGVDWAAPIGTPIFAAGNGTIEEIGLKGGYGKYVRIRHANGYETAYGHMTAFARGLDVGTESAAGPGHRLRRLDRHVDRLARAFRNSHQRPLRRSDEGQAAARPRARRRDARANSRRIATSSTPCWRALTAGARRAGALASSPSPLWGGGWGSGGERER